MLAETFHPFQPSMCEVMGAAQGMAIREQSGIEGLCRSRATRFMDTLAKQVNPAFRYELREFRSSAEELRRPSARDEFRQAKEFAGRCPKAC